MRGNKVSGQRRVTLGRPGSGWHACALLFACLLALGVGPAQAAEPGAGERVALVIGNGGYDGGDRLSTPVSDAQLIGDTFRQLGFETRISDDQTQEEFNQSVDWLARHARGAQVAVFYYAGHGFESHGDNFLVPVKTGIAVKAMTYADLLKHAIKLRTVRTEVNQSRPAVFVSLIDACREPSRGATTLRFKQEDAAHGELIAYSTADQAIAYDSMRAFGQPVDDSPFAYYLATYLKAPNATFKQALEQTQQQVADITGGQQTPWISSGLIHDFVVSRPLAMADTARPAPAVVAARGMTRGEPASDGNVGIMAPRSPDEQAAAATWAEAAYRIGQAAASADRMSIQALQARKGDPAALTVLGAIAEQGGGGSRVDPRLAIGYYRRAAALGYPIAETRLGEIYMEGQYLKRDYGLAQAWFAKAAAQHYRAAELDLALIRSQRNQAGGTQELARAMMNSFNGWVGVVNAHRSDVNHP